MRDGNDGSRLSRLALDRYATGELTGAERSQTEGQIDARGQAHLDALEAAKASVPPFDAGSIRLRAASAEIVPANNVRGFSRGMWSAAILVAAALLLVIGLPLVGGSGSVDPVGPSDLYNVKSGDTLLLSTWNGRALQVYSAGTALGEGDKLGLQVSAEGHRGVVVLSVDGGGNVSVFYPEQGDAPEPLAGTGLVALAGSIALDGAKGPEIFVAVWDKTVTEARALVENAYASGGHAEVVRFADQTDDIDTVEVTRR